MTPFSPYVGFWDIPLDCPPYFLPSECFAAKHSANLPIYPTLALTTSVPLWSPCMSNLQTGFCPYRSIQINPNPVPFCVSASSQWVRTGLKEGLGFPSFVHIKCWRVSGTELHVEVENKLSEVSQVQNLIEQCFLQDSVNLKCYFHHLLFFLFVLFFTERVKMHFASFVMVPAEICLPTHSYGFHFSPIYGGFYNQIESPSLSSLLNSSMIK